MADEPASEPTPAPTPAPSPSPSPSPEPAPAPAPTPTNALNQQIVQAVDKTNAVILGSSGAEGAGIAYQKVAQATAFSVQDSTDYLRNIMTMAATAQGVCLQLMISTKEVDPYAKIITEAINAVTKAQENFQQVGMSATAVVEAYPSS